MPKTKEHSDDFKNALINAIKEGKNQIHVAKDFGLSRKNVNTWNKKQLFTGTTINK